MQVNAPVYMFPLFSNHACPGASGIAVATVAGVPSVSHTVAVFEGRLWIMALFLEEFAAKTDVVVVLALTVVGVPLPALLAATLPRLITLTKNSPFFLIENQKILQSYS